MRIAVQSQMLVMSCFVVSLFSFSLLGLQFYKSSTLQTKMAVINLEKNEVAHLESMLGQWFTTIDLFFNNRQSYLLIGIERQGWQIITKLDNLPEAAKHAPKALEILKENLTTSLKLVNHAAVIGPEHSKNWLTILEQVDKNTTDIILQYDTLTNTLKTLSTRSEQTYLKQRTYLIYGFYIAMALTIALLIFLGAWNSKRIITPLKKLSYLTQDTTIKDIPVELKHAPFEIQVIYQRLTSSFIKLAEGKKQAEQDSEKIKVQNKALQENITQLEETRQQLVTSEKLASIGQLAAGVAHEINNPVGFVLSNLSCLDDYHQDLSKYIVATCALLPNNPELEKHFKEYDIEFIIKDLSPILGSSISGLGRVKKIVKDLRVVSHNMPDQVRDINLDELLAQAINLVKPSISPAITITTSITKQIIIQGIESKLTQVFVNLLTNSADAISEENDNPGEIAITASCNEDYASIKISDTGCGMDDDTINKIFNPFFTTKSVGKGTGLGLHICHSIVQNHNAKISVKSALKKGTTFTLTFKCKHE